MNVSILLTSLGLVFVHRILGSSLRKIGLSNLHTRIFLSFAGLMILFHSFFSSDPILLWFFFGTILVLLSFLPHFFSRYQEKLIQAHTLRLVDHLILSVQSGHSLRASLGLVSQQESSLLRVSWENLAHALIFEDSPKSLKSPALKNLFEELSRIERSQAKCVDQLRSFRAHLKTFEDFRRRSGQVTLQIRMQAAISTLLFLGLSLFMFTQFGFNQHRVLFLAAGTLFFTGMVTVFVIGRRLKWST